ncbi:MAG TPA: hypothetical protein PLC55_10905 [Zoogloea sp.]|nr:hypothetical protein [Zoogloea sp.]
MERVPSMQRNAFPVQPYLISSKRAGSKKPQINNKNQLLAEILKKPSDATGKRR